jgi:hypothetical protein
MKVIKTIEEEVLRILSNKKALLKLAVLSIFESIRKDPDKYSSLINHHSDNFYSSLATVEYGTGQGYAPADYPYMHRRSPSLSSLPQQEQQSHLPQNHYIEMLMKEAEKLYNSLAIDLYVKLLTKT